MNIILIGFAASGKTTVGKLLARQADMQFSDLDEAIEHLHRLRKGAPLRCRDILTRYGRECFIGYEKEALGEYGEMHNTVLATGGGVVLDPQNRSQLTLMGKNVYLYVTPEVIFNRMKLRGFPAYLGGHDSLEEIERHCSERDALYRSIADVVIDNSGLTPGEVAPVILKKLSTGDV